MLRRGLCGSGRARPARLGPPERDRGDVSGDDLSTSIVIGLQGVCESALLEVGGLGPRSCGEHPEQTESVGRVTMIPCLLKHGHKWLEVTSELWMLLLTSCLHGN